MNKHYPRIEWVDSLKGIGIFLVIAGHILEGAIRSPIYLFHMPLFFLISGYLFRSKGFFTQIFHQIRSLHIPVCCSIITIIIDFYILPSLFYHNIINIDSFKEFLQQGNFVVLWFVAAISLTYLISELLEFFSPFGQLIFLLGCFAFSYANEHFRIFDPPLSLGSVTIALPFFALGQWFNRHSNFTPFSSIYILPALLIIAYFLPSLHFDLWAGEYGIFGVSFIAASLASWGMISLARLTTKFPKALETSGRCSLAIMLAHQPIQISLQNISIFSNSYVRLIVTTLICCLIVFVIDKSRLLSLLYLGRRTIKMPY
jgi:fucose 4-O-acetylase-like acetyltransferase